MHQHACNMYSYVVIYIKRNFQYEFLISQCTCFYLSSCERQNSLEDAFSRFSIKKGTTPTHEYSRTGPIPLCIPNNYQWNEKTGKLELIDNVQRTGLAACNQGLQFLRSITGPVCVVCVVGPARTGKSYLLGQLQGSTFRLGHTMKAETMGTLISCLITTKPSFHVREQTGCMGVMRKYTGKRFEQGRGFRYSLARRVFCHLIQEQLLQR